MTQEEKKLLLKDICARLPYDLCVNYVKGGMSFCRGFDSLLYQEALLSIEDPCFKPYLRPMSSMTEEEKNEISKKLNYEFYVDDEGALCAEDDRHRVRADLIEIYIEWLNEHHFDYRDLIEKGLALQAPEGMYVIE